MPVCPFCRQEKRLQKHHFIPKRILPKLRKDMPDLANFLDCLRLMVCKECEDDWLHPENKWHKKFKNLQVLVNQLEEKLLNNPHIKELEMIITRRNGEIADLKTQLRTFDKLKKELDRKTEMLRHFNQKH